MSHHKRKRPRNRRGGCKMCKYWKVNGFSTERKDGEKFSDHRRRVVAKVACDETILARGWGSEEEDRAWASL